jgi:hypothetical protein
MAIDKEIPSKISETEGRKEIIGKTKEGLAEIKPSVKLAQSPGGVLDYIFGDDPKRMIEFLTDYFKGGLGSALTVVKDTVSEGEQFVRGDVRDDINEKTIWEVFPKNFETVTIKSYINRATTKLFLNDTETDTIDYFKTVLQDVITRSFNLRFDLIQSDPKYKDFYNLERLMKIQENLQSNLDTIIDSSGLLQIYRKYNWESLTPNKREKMKSKIYEEMHPLWEKMISRTVMFIEIASREPGSYKRGIF